MYTDYSKIGITPEEQIPETDNLVTADEIDEFEVESEVEEAETEIDDILIGTVTRCSKLNVRQEPKADAMIIGTLPVSSEVMIYETESTEDFYKICTASGMEGYCVKGYITIQ